MGTPLHSRGFYWIGIQKEAAIAEREAIAAKAAANKEAAEKKAAEAKAKIEAQKQQKAEDTRVIGELKEKAKIRKKQNRAVAREEKRRQKTEKRAAFLRGVGNFFKKIKNLLFGGWHKIVTFIVILIIITIPVGFIIANGIEREARKEVDVLLKLKDKKIIIEMNTSEFSRRKRDRN